MRSLGTMRQMLLTELLLEMWHIKGLASKKFEIQQSTGNVLATIF